MAPLNVTRTRRMLVLAAGLAVGAAACGDDGVGPAPGLPRARQPGGKEVTLVAQNTAFDTTALAAAAGETLTITYDNRDDDITHNLHVKGAKGGDAKTDIEAGPITQTLEVTFDAPGTFDYVCDVHPQQMTGTITVTS